MIGYYFITDSGLSCSGNLSDVKNALAAKVKFVQYRAKQLNTKEMYAEALKLRKICKDVNFLINDRVDIAGAVGADGVHIGQADLPYRAARKILGKKRIIGITAHNINEAKEAQGLGADYVGVSPIFRSGTKQDAVGPIGIAMLKAIRERIRIPIIAVGGINLSNAGEVIRAGADGLCAVSSVVAKGNVKWEIEKFQGLFKQLYING